MHHPGALREKAFAQAVLDLARWCGWLCYHTFDSRRSVPGFPDLVLVRPPSVVVAELKTDRGRLTPVQRDWLEALTQCPGLEVYVWRPSDWEAIAARLQRC
jgi:VRR-NUC domain